MPHTPSTGFFTIFSPSVRLFLYHHNKKKKKNLDIFFSLSYLISSLLTSFFISFKKKKKNFLIAVPIRDNLICRYSEPACLELLGISPPKKPLAFPHAQVLIGRDRVTLGDKNVTKCDTSRNSESGNIIKHN